MFHLNSAESVNVDTGPVLPVAMTFQVLVEVPGPPLLA
jgi:hypothetical protein